MPTRRTNDDAMINEFSKARAELDRAAVAEAEAWANLEQELERELGRAIEAARGLLTRRLSDPVSADNCPFPRGPLYPP